MYYELYVDSLFLVNFVMNLYLLLLVNQSTFRTATRRRMIAGAALGAVLYLLPFLWNGPPMLKLFIGFGMGTPGMLFVTFGVKSFRTFWRLLEKLFLWSLMLGGTLLFLLGRVPFLQKNMTGVFGILGMGALAFCLFSYIQQHEAEKKSHCQVTLLCEGGSMKVAALIDSGNSLVEPISGKPVSIIEKTVFQSLWREAPSYYRAIPYHSIGKKHGILRGYPVPEIRIDVNGITKVCKDVYVAVSEEHIAGNQASHEEEGRKDMETLWQGKQGVRMILNPALLEELQNRA